MGVLVFLSANSINSSSSVEEILATHSSVLTWRIPWQRRLAVYGPWVHKESDTTEQLNTQHSSGGPSFSKYLPTPSTHHLLCVYNIISKIRELSQVISKFLSTYMMVLFYVCNDLFALITQYKYQQKHGEIMRIVISLRHFKANWYQLPHIFWRMRHYALGWIIGIPGLYNRNC